jgi:hypothetical protein
MVFSHSARLATCGTPKRETEAPKFFHIAADIFFGQANCCFVGLSSGDRAAGESLAAHRALPPQPPDAGHRPRPEVGLISRLPTFADLK